MSIKLMELFFLAITTTLQPLKFVSSRPQKFPTKIHSYRQRNYFWLKSFHRIIPMYHTYKLITLAVDSYAGPEKRFKKIASNFHFFFRLERFGKVARQINTFSFVWAHQVSEYTVRVARVLEKPRTTYLYGRSNLLKK